MPDPTPSQPVHRLRIVGTGEHHLTRVLDADTGEDIGAKLKVLRIHLTVGDRNAYPAPHVTLEIGCSVIFELAPAGEQAPAPERPEAAPPSSWRPYREFIAENAPPPGATLHLLPCQPYWTGNDDEAVFRLPPNGKVCGHVFWLHGGGAGPTAMDECAEIDETGRLLRFSYHLLYPGAELQVIAYTPPRLGGAGSL